jgi:hypothetical protein
MIETINAIVVPNVSGVMALRRDRVPERWAAATGDTAAVGGGSGDVTAITTMGVTDATGARRVAGTPWVRAFDRGAGLELPRSDARSRITIVNIRKIAQ